MCRQKKSGGMEQVKELLRVTQSDADFLEKYRAAFELDEIRRLIQTSGSVAGLCSYNKERIRAILERQEPSAHDTNKSPYRYRLNFDKHSLEQLLEMKKVIDGFGWDDLKEDWQCAYDWLHPQYVEHLLQVPAWSSDKIRHALKVLGTDIAQDKRDLLEEKAKQAEEQHTQAKSHNAQSVGDAKKKRKF